MKKRLIAIALLVVFALSLVGCGANAAPSDTSAESESYADYSKPADTMAPAPSEAPSAGGLGVTSDSANGNTNTTQDKIIYSVYAEMETQDFDKTIEGIHSMIAEFGGFLESSSVNGNNYYTTYYGGESHRSATFVIRVPAERLEELKTTLSTLGNVPYINTDTDNISTQYYDAEARLESLNIQEDRLLAMLEQAETVEDMLTIEGYLSDVRYEIESLTTKLNGWDSLVSYSTVTLEVQEVVVYTEETPVVRTYWQRVGDDFMDSLDDVGDFFKDLLRWFVGSLPVLVLLGVIAAVIIILSRRSIKKRRARKAAEHQEYLRRVQQSRENNEQK